MARAGMPPPLPITCSALAAALLGPRFRGLACEQVCVLNLDAELRPLGITRVPPGTADRIHLPVRTVMAEALRCDARTLILAHNHPAGDAVPSRADRDATCRLAAAGRYLGIAILDHLIFAAGGWVSFRAMRLL